MGGVKIIGKGRHEQTQNTKCFSKKVFMFSFYKTNFNFRKRCQAFEHQSFGIVIMLVEIMQ